MEASGDGTRRVMTFNRPVLRVFVNFLLHISTHTLTPDRGSPLVTITCSTIVTILVHMTILVTL